MISGGVFWWGGGCLWVVVCLNLEEAGVGAVLLALWWKWQAGREHNGWNLWVGFDHRVGRGDVRGRRS